MKKLFFLSSFIVLLSIGSSAQETFFKFVTGWRNHKIQEHDNSYVSVGTATLINNNHVVYSEAISMFGDSIYSCFFQVDTANQTYHRYTNSTLNIGNSNYSAVYLKTQTTQKYYGALIKFNEDFSDTIYSKLYDNLGTDGSSLYLCTIKNDTSLILGSFSKTEDNLYTTFLETDTLGNIRWQKDFDCSGDCHLGPFHILPTEDNGFIFTCYEDHINGQPGVESVQTAVIKTDSLGNTQWRHTWGGDTTKNFGSWVVPLDDGNYLYAWTDNEYTGWNAQANYETTVRFAKFDIVGNIIWIKDISEYLEGKNFSITQMEMMPDGNIILAGYNGVWGGLIKIDQEANLIWYRGKVMPPGLAYEENTASQQQMKILGVTFTSDNGFILAGEYISSAGNMFDELFQSAYAYKLDEYGCYTPGCQIHDAVEEKNIEEDNGFSISPNPANDFVIINCHFDRSGEISNNTVKFYNLQGQLVKQLVISPTVESTMSNRVEAAMSNGVVSVMSSGVELVMSSGVETSIKINITDLKKGVYLIKIGSQTQKLIVQ